jgi:hypothetical protein
MDPQMKNSQSKIKQDKANSTLNKKKATVESLHSEIVDNLIDREEGEEPVDIEHYKDVLTASDRDERTLLHRIILRLKKKNDTTSEEILAVVDRIVIDSPNLLTKEDGYRKIPLTEAAESTVDILFRVISLVMTDNIQDILKAPCNDKDCALRSVKLHERLVENYRRKNTDRGKIDVQYEPDPRKVTDVEDDNPDVCLHSQLNLEKLKDWNDELKKQLSNGLIHMAKTKSNCLQSLINAKNFDPGTYINGNPTIPLESFSLLLKLCPGDLFTTKQKGFSPLQSAIQLYKESAVDYGHLLLVMKELVERSPSSIYVEAGVEAGDNKGKTAYQLLIELEMNRKEFGSGERSKSIQEAKEMLKKACIGLASAEHDSANKLKFLYWGDATRSMSLRHFFTDLFANCEV